MLLAVALWVTISAEELRARYDTVWAISDVHGRVGAFEQLLAGAGLGSRGMHWEPSRGRQLLIVAGDFVDEDCATAWRWRELQREAEAAGSRVVLLLGNHEEPLLSTPGAAGDYLRSLPVAAVVGEWLFVHDVKVLGVEHRRWWTTRGRVADLKAQLAARGLSALVFGHDPDALDAPGTIAMNRDGWLVKLDAGMKRGAPGLLLRCPAGALSLCEVVGEEGRRAALRRTRR